MITGVALFLHGGQVIALPKPHRHHHLFALASLIGIDAVDALQGFMTDVGTFLDRKRARIRAEAFKQIIKGPQDSAELFSEDLW